MYCIHNVLETPANFLKITDGLVLFLADIWISRIYVDNR